MAVKKTSKKQTASKTTARSSSRNRTRTTAEKHKAAASRTRKTLVNKLKKDLQATKQALKSATRAANTELKLARTAAKAEINVLKDQLSAALKREEALRKLSQEKAKMMWKAGEQWEKQQLARLKENFKKTSRSGR